MSCRLNLWPFHLWVHDVDIWTESPRHKITDLFLSLHSFAKIVQITAITKIVVVVPKPSGKHLNTPLRAKSNCLESSTSLPLAFFLPSLFVNFSTLDSQLFLSCPVFCDWLSCRSRLEDETPLLRRVQSSKKRETHYILLIFISNSSFYG